MVFRNISQNEIHSWRFPENLGSSRRGNITDCGGAAAVHVAADDDDDPDDEDEAGNVIFGP